MLVIAGIAAVTILVLALAVLFERGRSREAVEASRAAVSRARKRAEGHSARLEQLSRAAASIGTSGDVRDPA